MGERFDMGPHGTCTECEARRVPVVLLGPEYQAAVCMSCLEQAAKELREYIGAAGRYKWWPSESKHCEPEIVTIEPWPASHGPTPAGGWVFLRFEKPGQGEGVAIKLERFYRTRHQRLKDKKNPGPASPARVLQGASAPLKD